MALHMRSIFARSWEGFDAIAFKETPSKGMPALLGGWVQSGEPNQGVPAQAASDQPGNPFVVGVFLFGKC